MKSNFLRYKLLPLLSLIYSLCSPIQMSISKLLSTSLYILSVSFVLVVWLYQGVVHISYFHTVLWRGNRQVWTMGIGSTGQFKRYCQVSIQSPHSEVAVVFQFQQYHRVLSTWYTPPSSWPSRITTVLFPITVSSMFLGNSVRSIVTVICQIQLQQPVLKTLPTNLRDTALLCTSNAIVHFKLDTKLRPRMYLVPRDWSHKLSPSTLYVWMSWTI